MLHPESQGHLSGGAISKLTAEESRTHPRVGGARGGTGTGSGDSVERQRKQHKQSHGCERMWSVE